MQCNAKIPTFWSNKVIDFEFAEIFLKLPIIHFYGASEVKSNSDSCVKERMNDFSTPMTNEN